MAGTGEEQPNVVWVTLDSVRHDHTTVGGYERDTTPNLARIVDDGGRAFSNCFSHGMYTLSSSASILTGTYPAFHRVGLEGERIPDDVPTVAERFRDAGYRTACISRNSYLSSATGLDRGFDRFSWLSASTLLEEVGPLLTLRYLWNLRQHSAGFTRDTAKHSTPYLVEQLARRWLENDLASREPFFCYLHFNEPHRPYYPPLPYLSRFTDDLEMSAREAAAFSMDVHRNFYQYIAEGVPFSDEEWAALVAMYDAEIAYTDERIGALYDYVRSLDVGNTVFVVTADHGELFGERNVMGHQYLLHDGLLNVPAVVAGVGEQFGDADALVQHADLMTTLLGVAGASDDGLQGVDLGEQSREYVYAQRHAPDFDHVLQYNTGFDPSPYHTGELSCVRTLDYKYLESADRRELFELPDEETEVLTDSADVGEELATKLEEWRETAGRSARDAETAAFDPEMRTQLQDLGYLE